MRSWQKTALVATAFFALTGASAFAEPGKANPPGKPNPPGNAYGQNGKPGGGKGVPGPIAGAGIPFLLIAGGYALVRRHRNRAA